LLRKLLFGSIPEFIPVTVNSTSISEKEFANNEEVTGKSILISLQPVIFAIWGMNIPAGEAVNFEIVIDGETIAYTHGETLKTIDQQGEFLTLWTPHITNLPKLTFIQRAIETSKIWKQSKKSKFLFSRNDIRLIASAYMLPRKVYVVVVAAEQYLNIFPMDLHLQSPNRQNYSFALQPSNSAEQHLKKTGKVLVGEIDSQHLKNAYLLGKNHGKTNLQELELPFKTSSSKTFKFPVPEFCIGYKEILIDHYETTGSHTLFTGHIIQQQMVKESEIQPHHIHRFHFDYCKKNAGLKEMYLKL